MRIIPLGNLLRKYYSLPTNSSLQSAAHSKLSTTLGGEPEFSYMARKHWAIENQPHWCLDVIFREDAAKVRKDNFPLIF